MAVRDGVRIGCVMVRIGCVMVRIGCVMVRIGCVMVRNGAVMVRVGVTWWVCVIAGAPIRLAGRVTHRPFG
jgi:hypothetical protein